MGPPDMGEARDSRNGAIGVLRTGQGGRDQRSLPEMGAVDNGGGFTRSDVPTQTSGLKQWGDSKQAFHPRAVAPLEACSSLFVFHIFQVAVSPPCLTQPTFTASR